MLTEKDWEGMYKAQEEDFRKMRIEVIRLRSELAKALRGELPQTKSHESNEQPQRLPWIEGNNE